MEKDIMKEKLEKMKEILSAKQDMKSIDEEIKRMQDELKEIEREETLLDSKLEEIKKEKIAKKQSEIDEITVKREEMSQEIKEKTEALKNELKTSIQEEIDTYKRREDIEKQRPKIELYRQGVMNLTKEVEKLEQEVQEIAEEVKNGDTSRMERMNAASALLKSDKDRIANMKSEIEKFENYKVLEDNIEEYKKLKHKMISLEGGWNIENEMEFIGVENELKSEQEPESEPYAENEMGIESNDESGSQVIEELTDESSKRDEMEGMLTREEIDRLLGNVFEDKNNDELGDEESKSNIVPDFLGEENNEDNNLIPKESRLSKIGGWFSDLWGKISASKIAGFFKKLFSKITNIGKKAVQFVTKRDMSYYTDSIVEDEYDVDKSDKELIEDIVQNITETGDATDIAFIKRHADKNARSLKSPVILNDSKGRGIILNIDGTIELVREEKENTDVDNSYANPWIDEDAAKKVVTQSNVDNLKDDDVVVTSEDENSKEDR